IHHEGDLLAIGRVDRTVLSSRGYGFVGRRRKDILLAGCEVASNNGTGAFAVAFCIRLDGGNRHRLSVRSEGGPAREKGGRGKRLDCAFGYVRQQRRHCLILE